jgi:hypothetical protein
VPSFSPQGQWTQVDRREVQAVLRRWFTDWGLPGQVRLDNGQPWGGWSDIPPDLALWLLGLGIALHWNRPRHKQGNAVIERGHGVCQRWVEPHTCQSPAELQTRLDYFTTLQRERYPAIDGQSRVDAFPALAAGGRPYDPAQEAEQWDEHRVWAVVGQRVWVRRVDKVGRISVLNRAVAVGRAWARQAVTVRVVVHADAPHWQIRDHQGVLLRQHPAPELRRDRLLALDVSRRRHRPRRPAKPRVRQEG